MSDKPSFKRHKWKLFALGAGIILLAVIFHSSEPSYQGMKLSECLIAQDVSLPSYTEELDKKSEEAIRQMGPKAVPHLIKMLHAQDSIWLQWRIYLSWKLDWLHLNAPPDASQLHWRGAVGIGILGPQAKAAIPDLLALLDDPDDEMRAQVIDLLDDVQLADEQMIPLLRKALADPSARVVVQALDSLGKRGSAARPAVPSITSLLNHPDHNVRHDAMQALQSLSTTEPERLTEPLQKQLTDSHALVRGKAMIQFAEREQDEPTRHLGLTRFLSDPDASIRFKATNLLHSITFTNVPPDPVWPRAFAMNEIPLVDFFSVLQQGFGVQLQLSPRINTSTLIRIDTYGYLPKTESIELLKQVLKEQAGLDLQILSSGVMSVTQSPAPAKPVP